jgi:hypothetical protein
VRSPPGISPRGLTDVRTIGVLRNYCFQRVDSTCLAKALLVVFATAARDAIVRVNGPHPATNVSTRTAARRGDVYFRIVPPLAAYQRTDNVGW